MRKYLETLHERPAHYKKRFAMIISLGFTLLMASLWTLITFGNGGVLAENSSTRIESDNKTKDVSPFESILSGASLSIDSIKKSFEELKVSVFDTYGQ